MQVQPTLAREWLKPLQPHDAFLPEGPRWIHAFGQRALAWVNIQRSAAEPKGDVHLYLPARDERKVFPQPKRPGCLFPTSQENCLLVGMEKELGWLDLQQNRFEPVARIPDSSPRTIINDGEILPDGSGIVFGTKDLLFADAIAHLYLYTLADNQITILADQQTCSNGKVIHSYEDHLLMYDIDTPTRELREYRLDLTERKLYLQRKVVDFSTYAGFPDGMVDTGRNSVIVAMYDPAVVDHGYAHELDLSSGELRQSWKVPGSPRVTCPLLWPDASGIKLILTTCSEGMPETVANVAPAAGSLFVVDTDLPHCPKPLVVQTA